MEGKLRTWLSLGLALGLMVTMAIALMLPVSAAPKGGGGGKPPKDPPADEIPPDAVTPLNVDSWTADTVTLSWTATGDDGMDGTASSYDVRYSTSPIDDGNWGSAYQATGEPVPQAPLSPETFTVNGLLPDRTYFFRLKVADEVPNFSALSDEASATTDVGTWIVDEVDSGPVSGWILPVYDAGGKPSIAFASQGALRYAHFDGTSWGVEVVDPTGTEAIDLAFDPITGYPALSYGIARSLHFASFNGSSWDLEVVEAADVAVGTSLAFDSSGAPSICYRGKTGKGKRAKKGLRFAVKNGSSWDLEFVREADNALVHDGGHAYDSSGAPCVAFRTLIPNTFYYDMLYARHDGVAWVIETIEANARKPAGPNLAFDNSGNPSVDYRWWSQGAGGDNGFIGFASRIGPDDWPSEIVDNSCRTYNAGGPLAFDSSGTPWVSFASDHSGPNSPCAGVWVAHFDGAQWMKEVVRTGYASGVHLALDSSGQPSVAYRDNVTGALLFAYK